VPISTSQRGSRERRPLASTTSRPRSSGAGPLPLRARR
jgi:hypothetical protein